MTAVELVKMLYNEGFFSTWKTVNDVQERLHKDGFNFSDQLVLFSLNTAFKKNILSRKSDKSRVLFSQRQPPQINIKEEKLNDLNKILSEVTTKKLGEKFQQDIRELNIALTYDCGNSAAFVLRKILEKLIFHVFAKNGKVNLLKNNNRFIGLEAMIDLASKEEIKGIPILLPKTAKELLGIKFLCDSAAHDYIMNIDVIDINPQIPYWTVAIKESCDKLD